MERLRSSMAVSEACMTSCDILAIGATAEAAIFNIMGDGMRTLLAGMEGLPCLNQSYAPNMTNGLPDGHAREYLPARRNGERVHALGADLYPAVPVLTRGKRRSWP